MRNKRRNTTLKKAAISGALTASIIAGVTTSNIVFADPPTKPSGSSTSGNTLTKSGNSNSSVSYKGARTFTDTDSEANGSYTSTTASENAILVSGGTVNLTNPTVVKSGDDNSGDSADFYGTNAGILSHNSSKIKINGGTVTTDGTHANAVFAYGDSTIDVSKTVIKTTGNNSGGIMVTGGGTLEATSLDIVTSGDSSAAIRSDKGGGTMTVKGGKYEVSGTGSPVVYSTANISVSDATMVSTASEGVVIEGKNLVKLENDDITVTNTKLNGNSETYKAFFIYQSMSKDADEGTGNFAMKNSKVTNNKGDIFFVTNTTALIDLEHNTYVNNDTTGAFLRVASGKWGKSGQNGRNVSLYAKDDGIFGNIVIDNISTLAANLTEKAYYIGTINGEKTAKEINLTLDKSSTVVLTGDSYISSLVNEDTENSNIYANGHKLFVGGVEASINQSTPPEYSRDDENKTETEASSENKEDKTWLYWLLGAAGVAFVIALSVVFIILKKNKKNKRTFEETQAIAKVENNNMKKPWEQAQPLQNIKANKKALQSTPPVKKQVQKPTQKIDAVSPAKPPKTA